MTYRQALDYLFSQLPMFHRVGPAAYKANLDNTIALSNHLGQPERRFRSIHVAGTNGKGSVSHMLASVLQQQGYRTGLATSPHLKDFRERIRINGKKIPGNRVAAFVSRHKAFFEPLQASFFEISIALTFDYFAREGVDVAVVETGLGGRLDSTNLLAPELSVITGIGMDHMNLLGNTLEAIAGEKAGIIKPLTPVLIGRRQDEVHPVFERVARERQAPLTVASDVVALYAAHQRWRHGRPVLELETGSPFGAGLKAGCDLTGDYQKENVVTAMAALSLLGNRFPVSREALLGGLAHVRRNTGFAGRWQQIGRRPRIVCDTAHNQEGLSVVRQQLLRQDFERLHIVFGVVEDKALPEILPILPAGAAYYFCKPGVPRGLDATVLAHEAALHGLRGQAWPSVKEALSRAREMAGDRDMIFVGGSTFVVAEVL